MIIDKNTDLVIFDHKDILEILYNDNSAVLNSILGSDSDEEIKNYNNTADTFYYNKIKLATLDPLPTPNMIWFSFAIALR